MQNLRLAVIGTGHLGKIHARLAKQVESLDLVAVVDPDQKTCEAVAAEHEVVSCSTHRDLIGKIDAAIVATPTKFHFDVASELLDADIHVLVEKPITLSVEDADCLIDLANHRNLILQVGHVERFNPAYTHIQDQVENPRYIEANRSSSYTFRSTDVGVVLDLMIHDLDLILNLVPSEVESVQATGFTAFGPHEDMVQARLNFANGCVANVTASRVSYTPRRDMQIFANSGHFNLDFATKTLKQISPTPAVISSNWDPHQISDSQKETIKQHLFDSYLPLQTIEPAGCNAIEEEIKDFTESIRTSQVPQVTGKAGRDALAVAEMIVHAIEQHTWTDQDQILRGPRMSPEPKILSVNPEPTTTPLRKAG